MIATRALSLALGASTVLRDAALTFKPGRICVVIGPNGAGKSSLLKALAGLLPAASGDVLLDDTPISALPLAARARRISYLPQQADSAWGITVRELAELGRLPHRSAFAAPTAADALAVDAALAATGLSAFADRILYTLSGGEQARAHMARILATDPDWIIADEPLGALDPAHRRDALAQFRKAADAGKGVIMVLHQLNAAAMIADDFVVLKEGEVLAAGPCAEVLKPEVLEVAFGMPFRFLREDGRLAIVGA